MKRNVLTYLMVVLLVALAGLVQAEEKQVNEESGTELNQRGPGYGPGLGHRGMHGGGWRGGRGGKHRGDGYGDRRPVTSVEDARSQIAQYFEGQDVTVSDVADKQWRYEADIRDKQGAVIDRVMIDKRSGRIRSLY